MRAPAVSAQPLDVARGVAAGHAVLGPRFEEPAGVPLRSLGSAFIPAPERLGKVLQIDAEVPSTAHGALAVRALGDQQHSLLVEPLNATDSAAELTNDGRVVYHGAFGSADLITTVSERELNQTLVLKDDQAPATFGWKLTAGRELAGRDSAGHPLRSLRPQLLEDGRTAFLDEQANVRLYLERALIRDAAGREHSVPLVVGPSGEATLAVDYGSLSLPAVASFSFFAPTVGVFSLPPPPTVVKGRLMLMLDNSDSMMDNFAATANGGGDSSTAAVFCDNDLGTTFNCTKNVACTIANGGLNLFPYSVANGPSKIYAAKAAIQNVVNAHSGLIDFGLTRFFEPATCTNPVYCCNPQINATTPGRCLAATNGYVNWSKTPARTTGNDLTFAGTSCGPDDDHGGQILVSPSGSSGPQVIQWVDYVEDFCSSTGVVGGAPRNPEIRATNAGTPDARAVRSMRLQWYRPIYNVSKVGLATYNKNDPLFDSQLDCRSYVAVVMTDGQDTCNLDLSTEAGGFHGDNPANPPVIWALGMGAPGGLDVTELNQTMVAGGAGTTAPIAQNQQQIEAAFADIVASTVKFETCNGKDDNCNTSIDEGLGVYQECALGTECGSTTCDAGRCTCTSDIQCAAGFLCGVGAGTRYCRPACTVGVGTCNKSGIKKCGAGNGCCANDAAATCTALVAGTPGTETCNGLDDDCNGIIDDVPGGCQKTCTPELCNGLDDDCNGKVDDNPTDVGQPCGQPLIGICVPGTTACVAGVLKCNGGTPAGAEVCNGL
ncbi:MAG TPA: MopE-related protein, partial [Polyangiaceae bacterium]|nr:MopE-related protein [Polyangiaceae bacterium]